MADKDRKPKTTAADEPDFTPDDIKLIDAIWDRIGNADKSAKCQPGAPKPKD